MAVDTVVHGSSELRIESLAGEIHRRHARLAFAAAEWDSSGRWRETGARTCAHWLSLRTGLSVNTSGDLVRVGHSLEHLPQIAAAFEAGRISFDKVRQLTWVATGDDESMWLDIAMQASVSQLFRICRAVRNSLDADDPRRADDELARRGVRCWWREDGMLQLLGVLPREDGAVLMAALETVTRELAAERPADAVDPASNADKRPSLWADALVRISEQSIAMRSQEPAVAPTRQVVVHVDASVLTGGDGGNSHIEDGPAISARAARWLACDADVVTLVERDGLPIDVGRVHRVIPPRLRLAVQARDQGCRYPGCGAPARRTEGHHVEHWPDGGRTDLRNIISLCRFHHRRHHEGTFTIRVLDDGSFRFEASDGTSLVRVATEAQEEKSARSP